MHSSENLFYHEIRREVELIKVISQKSLCTEIELKLIHKASKRIQFMLEKISSLDNFIGHNNKQNKIKISFLNYLNEIVAEFKILYPASQVLLSSDVKSEIFVNQDPLILRMIILNMLENAYIHGNGLINISFEMFNEEVKLICTNKLSDTNNLVIKKSSGLGLKINFELSKLIGVSFYSKQDGEFDWKSCLQGKLI